MAVDGTEMTIAPPPKSVLPPDGTIIRVSQWRRQIIWIGAAAFAFLAVCVAIYGVQKGQPAIMIASAAYGFGALGFGRMALSGVILGPHEVTARSIWRTYHWRWDEIERFELRGRGEAPRLQIQLRNGRAKGFLGFFARSLVQEERGQALLRALEKRLDHEHHKHVAAGSN